MKKMTIFFSKNTGMIEGVFEDETSYENAFYGRHLDIQSYCIRVIVDYNINILAHAHRYKINLETKEIVLKEEFINNTVKLEF